MTTDTPLFISPCSAKSLWQEYRIYDDHLEFGTLLGTMEVHFDQIELVEVVESDLKRLLHGQVTLKGFRPALKLDWANFQEHIVLDKSEGLVRRLLFTPVNPTEFKVALENAMKQYKERKNGAASTT